MANLKTEHFGYQEEQFYVFRETFTGNGVATTFQLTGNVGNAVFEAGSWAVGNVETAMAADVSKTTRAALYDSVLPLVRHKISVVSISAGGLVTLDYPPMAENFYIWYWYDLEGDALSDYYRDDFVNSMEADAGVTIASGITTDTSAFDVLLSSADDTVQKALETLDKPITFTDTHEPSGFVSASSLSTLSFVDNTRVFTITPNPTYYIYADGKKYTKSGAASVTLDNTTQMNYIYFNSSGVLTNSATYTWNSGNALVALVYYDATAAKGRVSDERHGCAMDWATHEVLHDSIGAAYESGFALTFGNTTFTIGAGEFHDEDIAFDIAQQTTCIVIYRRSVGSPSTWRWDTAGTAYYKVDGSSNIMYDNAGTATAVPANQYMAMWIFVSNDKDTPIYALMGQRVDTTLANARANNVIEALDMTGLPSAEMLLLARVILRNDATPYEEKVDYRGSFVTGRSSVSYGAANTASSISTDVTSFGDALTAADTTVQNALETLDNLFSGLTAGYVPYWVSVAAGLANGPLYTDGSAIGFNTTSLSTWSDGYQGFHLGAQPAIMCGGSLLWILQNAYYNSGWKYKANNAASNIYFDINGTVHIQNAAVGAAGAALTWVDAFTFTIGGDLFITGGTISCSDLTDGYVPYHVSDAVGLANGPLWTDGTKIGLGTATVPHGGVGMALLALEGTNASTSGPHIQATTATDDYPLLQITPWAHDFVSIYFDAYQTDATTALSSSATGSYILQKYGGNLKFRYGSAAAGVNPTWYDVLGVIARNVYIYGAGVGAASPSTGRLEFDRTYDTATFTGSGVDHTANKIMLYNSAGSWVAGIGISSDAVNYYSGKFTKWVAGHAGEGTGWAGMLLWSDGSAGSSLVVGQCSNTLPAARGSINAVDTGGLYGACFVATELTTTSYEYIAFGETVNATTAYLIRYNSAHATYPQQVHLVNTANVEIQFWVNNQTQMTLSAQLLRVGVEDTRYGVFTASGHATGSAQGGLLYLETAADYDGTIAHYVAYTYEDDFRLGPSTDTDAILLTAEGILSFSMTGNKFGLGTQTVPHGGVGYALFALEGTDSNAAGPHVQFTTTADNYPVRQMLSWSHDNVWDAYDCYYNGAWVSSDAGSNFMLGKYLDALQYWCASGQAVGTNVSGWKIAISITASTAAVILYQQLFLGSNDARYGLIALFGAGTGSAQGGVQTFYLAADYDTTINFFILEAYEDDFLIGPNTDTDALKLTDAGDLHVTAGTVSCYDLTDGYIPYHVSDAAGLANGPLYTNGTNVAFRHTDLETWHASFYALEFPGTAIMTGAGNDLYLLGNTYLSAAGNWTRKAITDTCSLYGLEDGYFTWAVAAAGLADSTFTWTEVMRLTGAGELGVYCTPNARLEVEDGGTSKSVILKITQDDENPYGIVIGNDTYNTGDTTGLLMGLSNAGNAYITVSSGNLYLTSTTLIMSANYWIQTSLVHLIRESYFGYGGGGYKLTQVGSAAGISLGADITGNPGSQFQGNEIIIPNNRAIIAPTAANDTYKGVLRFGSDNYLYIGGDSYLTYGFMTFDTTGNAGIATQSVAPTARLEVEDGGTSNNIILKITQDDVNVRGLVIGNDSYSTNDNKGFEFRVDNSGDLTIYGDEFTLDRRLFSYLTYFRVYGTSQWTGTIIADTQAADQYSAFALYENGSLKHSIYHNHVNDALYFYSMGVDAMQLLYSGGSAWLYLGGNDVVSGMLSLYGAGTGAHEGAHLYMYTSADYDTHHHWYRFRVYDDDMYFEDQAGLVPFYLAYTGTYAGYTFNFWSAWRVTIGQDDTFYGELSLYGHGTGSNSGGVLYLYTGADHDATIDLFSILAYQDDLWIGPDTDQDALKLDSNKDFYVTAGSIVLPTSEYLNFGGTLGSGGYGLRDNAGYIQVKHSDYEDTWEDIERTHEISKAVILVEDFVMNSNLPSGWEDQNGGTAGAGYNSGSVVGTDANHIGVVELQTGTDAAGYDCVYSNMNLYADGGDLKFDTIVRVTNLSDGVNTYKAYAGLLSSPSAAPTSGIWFSYTHSEDGGSWRCSTGDGATTNTDSGIDVVAATWYRLTAIMSQNGATVKFYIDGVLVATHTNNVPTTHQIYQAVRIVKSAGTTSRSLICDAFYLRKRVSR
jgi:hypothetical protein